MSSLEHALRSALGSAVLRMTRMAGGDINEAYALELQDGRKLFVKTRADAPADMYAREADGLRWLAEANALPCPEVVAVDARFLVLRHVTSAARQPDFEQRLARGLAALHRSGAPSFGLAHDNYVGNLPQRNQPLPRFADFYRERRLMPLVERAASRGLIDANLRARFERLYARLDQRIAEEPPARLHGDLWSGNVHCDEQGQPMLIDPAVYGGHREIDLAMLQLFGAPSRAFFAAYDEVYPRAAESESRLALFQLYPLLVHVNLFGRSYLASLERALARYL